MRKLKKILVLFYYILNIIILITVIILLLAILSYMMKNMSVINKGDISLVIDILTICVSLLAPLIAVWGTYYYTNKINKETLEKQEKEFKKDREINLENQDKKLIIELIHNKQISEINIYIFHYNKFENKINQMAHASELPEEVYRIFQDWELISSYMISKKYRNIFSEVIKYRNIDEDGNKILKAPKNNKEVNEEKKIENYRREIKKLSKKLNEMEKKWEKE